MIKYICICIVSLFAVSCKHGAAKLDINDIESHRAYQDTILNYAKANGEYSNTLSSLITEYKSLELEKSNVRENVNLDYYLARLYNNVLNDDYFYYSLFDSVSKKVIDTVKYIIYKDSAKIYANRALEKDSNHLWSFYILSNSVYWEWMTFVKSKNTAPFFGVKSPNEFANTLWYIERNSYKFYNLDTSVYKIKGQQIIEHSYFYINASLLNFDYNNVNYENKANLEAYLLLEKYCNVLDKASKFYLLNKNEYLNNRNSVQRLIATSKFKLEEINRKENEAAEIARNTIIINHDGTKDWDSESTVRKLGKEVWSACLNYPNAIKIIVNVTDNCKDSYGKKTLYTSTFYITKSDMTEYRKYQDATSFNANCFDWGYKLMNEYKPCGRSQFPN